jgi:hypothetical protein
LDALAVLSVRAASATAMVRAAPQEITPRPPKISSRLDLRHVLARERVYTFGVL